MAKLKPRCAVILAAGRGRRLRNWELPKVLLEFNGKTLLQRHLDTLENCGVSHAFLTVGYQSQQVELALSRLNTSVDVKTVYNPDYELGSIVSLFVQKDCLLSDDPLLLMDADVLYSPELLHRLCKTTHESCFLVDRRFEPGEEAVKLCIKGGDIVDFAKMPTAEYDWCGESVGFFRLSAEAGSAIAEQVEHYMAAGELSLEYETAIRDVTLRMPERFGLEDITGLPWIEIDFSDDVQSARETVAPLIG